MVENEAGGAKGDAVVCPGSGAVKAGAAAVPVDAGVGAEGNGEKRCAQQTW